MLVTVTAAVAVLEPDQLASLRPALLAAMTYTSNWWQALHHQGYFTVFGPPPPLQHLWSLAIEEQFYLIWPLILTVILCAFRRRRARAAVVWLGAAASALAMAAGYASGAEPSRLYYGADTHAAALLVGAGLALGWPLQRLAAASEADTRRRDLIGVAGISVLAWELAHLSGSGGAVYLGGIAVAALAAGAVVVAAAGSGTLGSMLSWSPLRWIGIRSYGIYLWHWPVIALFAARAGTQSTAFGIRTAETAVAITLAAATWRWIEAPILRNGLGATLRSQRAAIARSVAAARQSPQRALPALIPVAAVTVACTAGYGVLYSPPGQTLQQQIAAGRRASAASVRHSSSGPDASPLLQPVPARNPVSLLQPVSLRQHPVHEHQRRSPPTSVSLRHPGRDVTAIGDSVMLAAAPQLRAALPGSYIDAEVSRQMSQGIAAVRQLAGRGELRPVVVVGLGTNGPITTAQIRALRAVTGPGRMLVLVNTFVPRPWQAEVNAVLAAAARQDRNVTLANWVMTIRNRTGLLWGDGVHPRPAGGVVYARMVAAAVRKAISRAGNAASRAASAAAGPAPGLGPAPAAAPAVQP